MAKRKLVKWKLTGENIMTKKYSRIIAVVMLVIYAY